MTPETLSITPATRAEVAALAERATQHDGVAPLSEEHLLGLSHQDAAVTVIHRDGAIAALASRVRESVEIVCDPVARRRGYGSALIAAELTRDPATAFWAHGNLPAAQATATSAGLTQSRELLHMVRPPSPAPDLATVPALSYADAVASGGGDEFLATWLALNARAFADHPEQGSWTMTDLRARLFESWFDPALLWLVEPEVAIPGPSAAASIWIKPTPEGKEIYVLAVDPDHAGRGLGTKMLGHALRAIGPNDVVDLYVDGDNAAARRLYERVGFVIQTRDVQYVTNA